MSDKLHFVADSKSKMNPTNLSKLYDFKDRRAVTGRIG
jgi:hypothetical protein